MRILDKAAILELIPHRAPFLFVDSARISDSNSIEGRCLWSAENPLLSGHLPGFPIVPGVMMIEGAAQLLALLLAHKALHQPLRYSTADIGSEPIGVLTLVRRAMFHKPVFPEQAIDCHVRIEGEIGAMFSARCEGSDSAGTRVFRCDIGVAVTDRSTLRTRPTASELALS